MLLPPARAGLAVQVYERPPVAVRVSVGLAQVSVPLSGLMSTVGGVMSCPMLMSVVLKQPVIVLVTVTENNPVWFTRAVPAVGFWLCKPVPAKAYSVPPVAVSVSEVPAQVSRPLLEAESVGVGGA